MSIVGLLRPVVYKHGRGNLELTIQRHGLTLVTRHETKTQKKKQFRKADDIIKSISGPLYTCSWLSVDGVYPPVYCTPVADCL